VFGKLRHKNLSLQSYYNSIRTDTLRASGSRTVILTNYDIYRFDLQQGLNLGRSKLILGGEYQWQRFDSKGLLFPAPVVQNLFGLYGQLETRLRPNFSLIIAGRVDHHPTVGFQASPKAGLIYTLFNVHSFRLTANQAYVNPVLVELFTDFSIEFVPGLFIGLRGNKNLEPRKITAFELGYQGFLQKKFKINLDIYQQYLKDFISPPRVINRSDPNAVSFVNFGQVRATGVDLGLLYLIRRGLSLSFNVSAISTEKLRNASAAAAWARCIAPAT
jgi:outer membrane receptor protein involved in Fe transport